MHSFKKLACLAALTSSVVGQTFNQIWNFTTFVDIENSALRENGNLLFTTFTNASLWSLDVGAANPVAELVMDFPGITAISGVVEIDTDTWAVSSCIFDLLSSANMRKITGGIRGSYHYTNESLFTIKFASNESSSATILSQIPMPDAAFLNGLAALPAYPHILLAGDSNLGSVFRVNTDNGSVEVAFSDPAFEFPVNATTPM